MTSRRNGNMRRDSTAWSHYFGKQSNSCLGVIRLVESSALGLSRYYRIEPTINNNRGSVHLAPNYLSTSFARITITIRPQTCTSDRHTWRHIADVGPVSVIRIIVVQQQWRTFLRKSMQVSFYDEQACGLFVCNMSGLIMDSILFGYILSL